jgi:hypothetical protein
MSVVALFDAASPAKPVTRSDPTAESRRRDQLMGTPCMRSLWMLKNAAVKPYRSDRGSEATVIIANSYASPTPPALAGRMRDDRVRTSVQPSITLLVPWIDAR